MWNALAKARDGALNKLGDVLGEVSDDDAGTVSDAGSDESTGSHFLADTDDDDAPEEEAQHRPEPPSPATVLLMNAAAVAAARQQDERVQATLNGCAALCRAGVACCAAQKGARRG